MFLGVLMAKVDSHESQAHQRFEGTGSWCGPSVHG
jgi:hypothetical protein